MTDNNCNLPNTLLPTNPIDPYAKPCEQIPQFNSCPVGQENLFHAPNASNFGLDKDTFYQREGLGEPNYCDPMTVGTIIEDLDAPKQPSDRTVIYRYSNGFRAIDEAVKKLFHNIKVIDDQGKVFGVPIIWGSQEKAVAAILQANVRKDNSGVVDRITLPAMSVYQTSQDFPKERYVYHMAMDYRRGINRVNNCDQPIGNPMGSPSTAYKEVRENDTVLGYTRGVPVNLGYKLTIWTSFWEDMNQIMEQISTKFNTHLAYIKVQGVTNWESVVKIDSVSSNLDTDPGEEKRVFKYEISLTAESYIPQPVIKRKSVLKAKVEFTDGISENEIQRILSRIEEAVND